MLAIARAYTCVHIHCACNPHLSQVDLLHHTRSVLHFSNTLNKSHCASNKTTHTQVAFWRPHVKFGWGAHTRMPNYGLSRRSTLRLDLRNLNVIRFVCEFLTGLIWARTKTISVQGYWFNIHFGWKPICFNADAHSHVFLWVAAWTMSDPVNEF